METIADLKSQLPQVGRLEWIGMATERRGPIRPVQEAIVKPGTGLEGEHHAKGRKSKRQVTLIQHEHLPVVASVLKEDNIAPELLRRNLVVSGINLLALKDLKFRIGEVLLEGSGLCAPCSRMEENLGPGGYNAMRGHGGITAIVLEGGKIRIGDLVSFVSDSGEPTGSDK